MTMGGLWKFSMIFILEAPKSSRPSRIFLICGQILQSCKQTCLVQCLPEFYQHLAFYRKDFQTSVFLGAQLHDYVECLVTALTKASPAPSILLSASLQAADKELMSKYISWYPDCLSSSIVSKLLVNGQKFSASINSQQKRELEQREKRVKSKQCWQSRKEL